MAKKKIIGASLGNCVHVAGVVHFLNLAADEGYETYFMGPAVSVDDILEYVKLNKVDIVSLGYRLTPENAVELVRELEEKAKDLPYNPIWTFGGTRPVAEAVAEVKFFDKIFDSTEDIDESILYLRGGARLHSEHRFSDKLVERIGQKQPYPLLRHHFGLPSYDDTIAGIEKIAGSKVLDIVSIGPDQNTQQFFYNPDKRDKRMDGAGGVPIRTERQFHKLWKAAQCGNYPLLRSYSGTADVMNMAKMLVQTIDNAWCAVPLSWYNELDGRGERTVEQSMKEAQELMRWHGEQSVPVEMNEAHHWALRDAHDTISVVMAYISAYNAKKCGVKDYINQSMFNVPNMLSFSMDLARVMAQIELVESLADDSFNIYRQTRAGLPFLSGDLDTAKGQLAASTYLQMAVNPHIIHVVGYSEAEHAATPEVVIESCKIVRGVIRSVLHGGVNECSDPNVIARKDELVSEARELLTFILQQYGDSSDDPFSDPEVLSDCIRRGIIDAPHIKKTEKFRGILTTRVIDGKCVAFDEDRKKVITERERLQQLMEVGNVKSKQDSGNKHGQRRSDDGSVLQTEGVRGFFIR